LLNSVEAEKPHLIDIVRVTGGSTHDYILHSAINWDQAWECSVPLIPNPAAYPMLQGEKWAEPATNYSGFPYYGFWRDVSSKQAKGNFQITYLDKNRKKSRDTHLWMADDEIVDIYIGRTPVGSRGDIAKPKDFYGAWRSSSIIRKRIPSGILESLFVSVIEPMNAGTSHIASVTRLPMAGETKESVGLKVTFKDGRVDTYLVNLHNQQVAGAEEAVATISTADANYSLTGRIGLHSQASKATRNWAVNATSFCYPGGNYAPKNLYYSGEIHAVTRRLSGGIHDAFITQTKLPTGKSLKGKQLSLTFGTLVKSGHIGISQMFEIDEVKLIDGQYHICLASDPLLQITEASTQELTRPLRIFKGVNRFEIALSACESATK
jgi:hypothetical protein